MLHHRHKALVTIGRRQECVRRLSPSTLYLMITLRIDKVTSEKHTIAFQIYYIPGTKQQTTDGQKKYNPHIETLITNIQQTHFVPQYELGGPAILRHRRTAWVASGRRTELARRLETPTLSSAANPIRLVSYDYTSHSYSNVRNTTHRVSDIPVCLANSNKQRTGR